VYLCVLCVKYIGANDLTQSTQRYAEIRRETRTANEPTFRAEPVQFNGTPAALRLLVSNLD
jgi:hypothetical protein